MLQTNCNSSNNSNSMDSDIVKRLEKLNKWQEEQKRMLNDRQNMQRQMLGLEQRNMYQMLGLLHPAEDDDVIVDDAADAILENVGVNFGNKKDVKHKLCTDNEFKGIFSFETLEGVTKLSSQGSSGKQVSTQNDLRLHPNMGPRLKQPFLRRGEGLKQRFKISPDALRLHNLPRYKYATNHPKIRNLQRQRFAPKAKPSQEDVRLRAGSEVMVKTKGTVGPSSRASTPMDMQEKQFQQVLMDSKHTCNSTPDEKNDKPAIAVMLPKVRFTGDAGDGKGQSSPCAEHYPEAVPLPSITWAKVLDSQQLRPINVQEMRAAGKHSERLRNKDAECAHSVDEGEDNLSIFELLERKACEGNIDMNSSCIKRFMERKRHPRPSELDESAAICVNECLTPVGLSPKVEVALRPDSSDEEHTQPEDNCSSTVCETTKNSIDLNETTKNDASLLASVNKPAHVRFAEKTGMQEYSASHELLDSSSSLGDDTAEYNRRSSDLFHQFKDALFNALLGKGADGDNSNDMRLALQSPPSALTQELQEKSNLIRARLDELEKEIAAFRENNQQLLRAKQAHDLEREHFTQERIELMDRLKDDRIQMEIYLHDERMKMEEERRNFQQYMSNQRLAASNKDRKEIARLKQELEAMHLQQKQREQAHASAQARLRVQIRNMERDQQHLRDDIERLTKENKKLQNDKSKLERDSNTRMLHEINRNIAKLAPKLTTSALPTTEPARTIYNGTKKIHHKMSPPGGKTKGNFTPKSQRKFSAPPPSRCLSNIDLHSSTKEVASVQTADPHVENHSSCDYDCNNNENENGEDLETDEDSFDNELEVKQTQILNKSQPTQLATNTKTETLTFSEKPAEQNENPANSTNDTNENFRREIVNADGSRDILYPNGNLKKISADGMNIRMLYFNKDIKETNVNEGTVRYYYAETNTWHTTYLDGLEILEFPNGQTEHRHKNGMVEVHFPDNSIKVTNPAEKNKLEEWRFADGTILIQMRNGDKILMLPNGQKEIHTKLNKRREYPDGTVKLVYPDGSQETRYSNGRVRLKDKDGHLVMDTESA